MIIHSIVDPFEIFYTPSLPQTECKSINGGVLELEKSADGYRVKSLFSTDPSLYLKKEYQPDSRYKI